MPELRISIPSELNQRITDAKPDYLDRKGFLCLLIDKALTGGVDYAPTVSVRDTQVTSASPQLDEPSTVQVANDDHEETTSSLTEEAVPSSVDDLNPFPKKIFVGEGIGMEPEEGERKPLISQTSLDPFRLKALDPKCVPEDLQHCSELLVDFWSVKKGTRSEKAAVRLFQKLRTMGPAEQKEALAAAYDAQWATVYTPKPDNPQQNKWNPEPVNNHPAARVYTAKDFYGEPEPNNPIDLLF